MKKSFLPILISAALVASAAGQSVVLNNKLNSGDVYAQTNGRVFRMSDGWPPWLFDGQNNNVGVEVFGGPSPNNLHLVGLGTYRAATDPKGYTGWDLGQFALGDDSPVNVPGLPAGATGYIRLRMWFDGSSQTGLYSSFAAAVADCGMTDEVLFPQSTSDLGATPPIPAPTLVGMPSVYLKWGCEYPVFVSRQPQSQTVLWGGTATLTVVAYGAGVKDFQWRFNGVNIGPDTTNVSLDPTNVLVLTNVQPSQAGNYSVRVSSVYGSALSDHATLRVSPAYLGVRVGMHPSLTITGTVGKTLGIRYTPDLTQSNSWINLTNLTLSSPVQEWIDTSVNAVGAPRRFYRVVPIP